MLFELLDSKWTKKRRLKNVYTLNVLLVIAADATVDTAAFVAAAKQDVRTSAAAIAAAKKEIVNGWCFEYPHIKELS